MENIKVIVKNPGQAPRKRTIPNELESLQKIVGGYIEVVTTADDLGIICNEEGKLKGLPYNCTIEGEDYVGPIIVVGLDDFEFTSCPIETKEFKEKYLHAVDAEDETYTFSKELLDILGIDPEDVSRASEDSSDWDPHPAHISFDSKREDALVEMGGDMIGLLAALSVLVTTLSEQSGESSLKIIAHMFMAQVEHEEPSFEEHMSWLTRLMAHAADRHEVSPQSLSIKMAQIFKIIDVVDKGLDEDDDDAEVIDLEGYIM